MFRSQNPHQCRPVLMSAIAGVFTPNPMESAALRAPAVEAAPAVGAVLAFKAAKKPAGYIHPSVKLQDIKQTENPRRHRHFYSYHEKQAIVFEYYQARLRGEHGAAKVIATQYGVTSFTLRSWYLFKYTRTTLAHAHAHRTRNAGYGVQSGKSGF